MELRTIDGYSLASFDASTQTEFLKRLQEPETWKPFNWFGFDYAASPIGSVSHGGSFGEGGMLAVVKSSGELVGQVQWIPGFWYGGANRNRAWNIGFIILPEHRRTRATPAALNLLISYLFTHTTANRIEAVTPAEALRKDVGIATTGLRREGTVREAQWREGKWHDVAILGILRHEWETLKA